MNNKRLIIILTIVALLLLIPFVAMQFTNEVNWTLFDFIVAGVLLLGTGLAIEFVIRNIKKRSHKLIIVAIVLVLLFVTWAEMAVGIFDSPIAGS